MDRERLTITIKKDLLKKIDKKIDKKIIRNRSHAIEFFLTQAMGPKINKAVILAGGECIKIKPFTYKIPKSMIPVKGKPLLEYTIELLKNNDIKNVLIITGHLGDKIKDYFKDGSRFGVKITYIEERERKGTAGSLRLAKKFVGNENFLVIYGDILIEIDLKDLIEFHKSQEDTMATLALTSVENPTAYGVVKLKGNKIVEFLEKPVESKDLSRLINAGVYVSSPEIFKFIPSKNISMIEDNILPKLAEKRKIAGYIFEGQWFDVGTQEVYERVIKEWKK